MIFYLPDTLYAAFPLLDDRYPATNLAPLSRVHRPFRCTTTAAGAAGTTAGTTAAGAAGTAAISA